MIKNAAGAIRRRTLLGVGVVALAVAGMQIGAASAQELVLKYNRWLPTTHPQDVGGMLPFFDEVAKVTEGRVRIEPTTASLAPAPRNLEAAQAGVFDVAYSGQPLTPGLFPLADAVALPLIGESAEAISVAYWRTHNKFFADAEKYPGVHLLALAATAPYHVYTVDKKIETIDDFAGLKLRATGAIAPKVAEALGAVPVPINLSDMYDALSKKVVDGALNSDDQMRSFGVTEFVKHRLGVPGGLLGFPLYVVINKEKWDQISPKDQEAITAIAGEKLGATLGRLADISSAQGFKKMEAEGAELSTTSGELLSDMKAKLKPIEDEWIAIAKEHGVDGAAALQMMREVAAEVEASKEPIKVE